MHTGLTAQTQRERPLRLCGDGPRFSASVPIIPAESETEIHLEVVQHSVASKPGEKHSIHNRGSLRQTIRRHARHRVPRVKRHTDQIIKQKPEPASVTEGGDPTISQSHPKNRLRLPPRAFLDKKQGGAAAGPHIRLESVIPGKCMPHSVV